MGGKWAQISRNMVGRSENSVKNRIYCIFNKLKLSPKNEEIDFYDNKVKRTLDDLLSKMENNQTYIDLESKIWKKKKKKMLCFPSESSSLHTSIIQKEPAHEEINVTTNAKIENSNSNFEVNQSIMATTSNSIQNMIQTNILASATSSNNDMNSCHQGNGISAAPDLAQAQILLQAQQNPAQNLLLQQLSANPLLLGQYMNGLNPRIIGMLPQGAIIINNTNNQIPIKQGVFDSVNRTLSFSTDSNLLNQVLPLNLASLSGLNGILNINNGSNSSFSSIGNGMNGNIQQKDFSSILSSQISVCNNTSGGKPNGVMNENNINIKLDDPMSAAKIALNSLSSHSSNNILNGNGSFHKPANHQSQEQNGKQSSLVFSLQQQQQQQQQPQANNHQNDQSQNQSSNGFNITIPNAQALNLLWQQLQQQQQQQQQQHVQQNILLQYQLQQLEHQQQLQLQQQQQQRILQIQNQPNLLQQELLKLNLQQQLAAIKKDGGVQQQNGVNGGHSNGNGISLNGNHSINGSLLNGNLLNGKINHYSSESDKQNNNMTGGGAQHKFNLLNQVGQTPSNIHQLTTHISLQYNNPSSQLAHENSNKLGKDH